MSGNFGPGQPRVPEPSRGMTYRSLIFDEAVETLRRPDAGEILDRAVLPVCSVEIIVDKQFAGISPDALGAVRAATGIADVTFEEILGGTGERGLSYTRVILRPTQREASSLIMTAIYSDVVNGVRQ